MPTTRASKQALDANFHKTHLDLAVLEKGNLIDYCDWTIAHSVCFYYEWLSYVSVK